MLLLLPSTQRNRAHSGAATASARSPLRVASVWPTSAPPGRRAAASVAKPLGATAGEHSSTQPKPRRQRRTKNARRGNGRSAHTPQWNTLATRSFLLLRRTASDAADSSATSSSRSPKFLRWPQTLRGGRVYLPCCNKPECEEIHDLPPGTVVHPTDAQQLLMTKQILGRERGFSNWRLPGNSWDPMLL